MHISLDHYGLLYILITSANCQLTAFEWINSLVFSHIKPTKQITQTAVLVVKYNLDI